MNRHPKYIKELALFLMLFVLASAPAVSGNFDTADREMAEIFSPAVDDAAEKTDATTADMAEISLEESADLSAVLSESADRIDREVKGESNSGIVPPLSVYGRLNAEWFKWAFSMPWDENHPLNNPGYDTPPESMDSSKPLPVNVVFLGSSFDPSYAADLERTITVSPGTGIFIPIFNVEASEIEGNGNTEEELQASADSWMDVVDILCVEIDGKPVKNPEQYVAPSGGFTYESLPEGNVLEALFGCDTTGQEGTLSAANGYYLLLSPLKPGEHTVHFETGGAFPQDVTYTIIVGGSGR